MDRPGRPHVVGVGGGVGTTTVATALLGIDDGVYQPGSLVDVLVARSTTASLLRAQEVLADTLEQGLVRPVLVVVADVLRGGLPNDGELRLRMTEPHTSGIVPVPFIEAWRHLEDPYALAGMTLRGQLSSAMPGRAGAAAAAGFIQAMREIEQRVLPVLLRRAAPGAAADMSRRAAAAMTARGVVGGTGRGADGRGAARQEARGRTRGGMPPGPAPAARQRDHPPAIGRGRAR